MANRPTTVRDYLAALPPDRRDALETLRKVFRANLDPGIEEGIQYGMIGYFIPHARYPAGYHCDPAQPLPFAGLASKKSHLSMHLMGCYMHGPWKDRFERAWKASGKALDMGAACVRFTSIDQVPLDVVAATLREITVDAYIERYESLRPAGATKKAAQKTDKGTKKRTATPAKKPVKKASAKTATTTASPARASAAARSGKVAKRPSRRARS